MVYLEKDESIFHHHHLKECVVKLRDLTTFSKFNLSLLRIIQFIMDVDQLPKVSVLVAARNEENSIAACLDALLVQDYPQDKLEIWVGNDQSEDETKAIIMDYERLYPNIHLLSIDCCLRHQKGKSNVLAQLAHKANGDFLFITDADMTVVPTWIKSMLTYFTTEIGIITGVTAVTGKSLFAKLQNAEWLFYTAHGHIHANKGKPVTAMGNNMALRTSAYWSTGGYEKISFSVTEDFELFKEVLKKGFKFQSVFDKASLGYTKPASSFGMLIKQRRRWITGAMQLPAAFVMGLVFLWAFLPLLMIICFFGKWQIAVVLFLVKWILDAGLLLKFYRKLNLIADAGIWLYTPASAVFNIILIILQLIPGPVEWKGRKYSQPYLPANPL